MNNENLNNQTNDFDQYNRSNYNNQPNAMDYNNESSNTNYSNQLDNSNTVIFKNAKNIFNQNKTMIIISSIILLILQEITILFINNNELLSATIALLISGILFFGYVKFYVKLTRNEYSNDKGYLKDLFSKPNMIFVYLLYIIFVLIGSLCGLLLLIVPGLIWFSQYALVPFIINDDSNIGFFNAMSQSKKIISKNNKQILKIFGYYLVLSFVVYFIFAIPREAIEFIIEIGNININVLTLLATITVNIIIYPKLYISLILFYDNIKKSRQ